MKAWLFAMILFTFSGPAAAQSGRFKSFARNKIQLAGTQGVAAGDALVLVVDKVCLEQNFSKKPVRHFPGFVVGRKTAGALEFPAWSAYATQPLTATELAAVLDGEPCLIGATREAVTRTASSDPRRNEQVALDAIGLDKGEKYFQHPLWGIKQPVTAAVIDSGIQLDHPDLAPRLWRGASGEAGFDFVNADMDPTDDNGHGTHVAGILGAEQDNGVGGRGVLGRLIQMMAVKTQDADGGGSLADLVNALQWSADHGADVINLSLSARMKNAAVEDALQYAIAKGSVVVAAAGNDGEEVTAGNFMLPSGYAKDNAGMISVGSIDAVTLLRSSFSNFGAAFIEMAAPGSVQGALGLLSTFTGSGYRNLNGTSQATPQVSAAAAIAISFYKTQGLSYTPETIETALARAAVQDAALGSSFAGGRRLDMERLGIYLFRSAVIDSSGGFDGN